MNVLSKVLYKIKRTINHCLIKNKDVTLITQNCIGGVLYHEYGLNFQSPTINLFIEDESFVKFVENLEYYLSIPATAFTDCFIDPIDDNIRYPKIRIDDIEVCCLHYKSCQEAVQAWERRRARVKWDNIRVIANSWNLHENTELIKRVCGTKYKTICLTYGNYDIPNCVQLKGNMWELDNRGIIRPNVTDFIPGTIYRYYEKQFDFRKWMNS